MGTPEGEWYVLFCKPRREQQVCSLFDSKGFETFHPAQAVLTNPHRPPQIQPFFPRYLFVRADLDAISTSGLEWISGAVPSRRVQLQQHASRLFGHFNEHLIPTSEDRLQEALTSQLRSVGKTGSQSGAEGQ